MSNPTWPPSLPQYPNQDGFSEEQADNTIRTQFDAGTMKLRRRYTAAPIKFTMSFTLTAAQKTTLETFFNTTLAGGSLPFDWVKPSDNAAATFVFRSPLKFSSYGPANFIVVAELQTVP